MMRRLLKYLLTLLSSMIQGDRMTCSIPATAQGQLYTMSNSAKSIRLWMKRKSDVSVLLMADS